MSYTYNDNGNLTNDGTYTYTWNTAGRLIEVESITTTVVYTYNGDGVRVAQSIDGVETSWVQDQASGLAEVLLEVTDGQTTVYLLGLGRLAQVEDGEWEWFLGDALGSVRQLVDDDGTVMLARDYAPFGLVLSESGTGSSGYGFTGEQAAVPGLSYLRARMYAPSLGRFLSADSFPGYVDHPQTLHRYAYCLNNAINAIDPSGMQGEPWWARPLGAVGESLKHIADPTRNPRTAAAHAAMWHGVSTTAERLDAWAGISDLYWQTIRYTGSAIMGGCWEQALRGGWGVAQQSAVLGASVVVAAGGTVATLAWGLVTTPVRIIKSGTAFGRAGWERLQGKGRGWDVVYTSVSTAGEVGSVLALYHAMAGGPPSTVAAQSADDIPAATVPRERVPALPSREDALPDYVLTGAERADWTARWVDYMDQLIRTQTPGSSLPWDMRVEMARSDYLAIYERVGIEEMPRPTIDFFYHDLDATGTILVDSKTKILPADASFAQAVEEFSQNMWRLFLFGGLEP